MTKNKNVLLDPNKLRTYIDQVGYKKDDILSDLRKTTESLGDISIMQIGQTQGSLIEMLCRIGSFRKCIEIGVFTGYSSICIAKGISEDGKLYALDNSIEYNDIARKYWAKSGCSKKIELIIRDAIESLDDFIKKGMGGSFDFIFIDADKNNYLNYYKKSYELVRRGGMILIDNTIWKGKVMDNDDKTSSTNSIRTLNNFIASDDRVDHCLLTIYDGLTLCIKK
tara:strand:- start:649 stop:1320 length:672 start_codon:yes stop_codon:yes gene_type:complete